MFMLTAALLLTAPASAVMPVDFRLADQPPKVMRPAPATPPGDPVPLAPSAVTGASPDLTEGDASDDQVAHSKPRFFVAHGFGHDVPLSFAVRQVVPARVRVSYGPGVNQALPVTWRGGKPWDDVLRAAVTPLGLHLVMTHMAVRIVE